MCFSKDTDICAHNTKREVDNRRGKLSLPLIFNDMKRILSLCLLVMLHAFAYAQFKTIAESPAFPEPEDGFARILQLKNGNTMLLLFSFGKGIDLKIFDAKHKQRVAKHLSPKYGKLRGPAIEAIFESGGDAVLLISEVEGRQPVLHRLVIDGIKGTLKNQEMIAQLPVVSLGKGYAMVFGKVPPPGFHVQKDPHSDMYAVAGFNSFESDRNKRIEVTLYNGSHQEVSRAFYTSPEEKYKYIEYIDMAIVGEAVHVMGYAFNTRNSGGKENVMVLGTLEKGGVAVEVKELEFAHDLEIDKGVLKYNTVTRKMMLLVFITKSKAIGANGNTRLAYIDPIKKTVETVDDIFPEDADIKSKELFGRRANYDGCPVNFFVNADGSFAVVYEDLGLTGGSSSIIGGSGSTIASSGPHAELKDIAVSMYDPGGKIIQSYFIPKRHYLWAGRPRSFYHAEREGRAAMLDKGDQFKSFAYINGKNKSYVLFNDVEENTEKVLKGKITTIKGVGECDAFYYPLEGENALPKRGFVYGEPDRRKDHNMALFAVSDYDREKNLYVTIKLNMEGRSKGVQVVWMEP